MQYYNSTYYAVKSEDTSTSTTPTNTNYWVTFTSFENVATGLVFAKEATIANWTFSNNYIKSTNGHIAFCANEADGDAVASAQYPFLAAGNGTNSKGWDSANNTINRNARIRLYSTGIIRLGEPSTTDSSITGNEVGLSGTGTNASSVRIWAGGTNRDSAPFRVTQSGSLYCTNSTIQTNSTGNRIVISSSGNNLAMYNSSGEKLCDLGWAATSVTNGTYYSPSLSLQDKLNSASPHENKMTSTGVYFYTNGNLMCSLSQSGLFLPNITLNSSGSKGSVYADSSGYLRIKL